MIRILFLLCATLLLSAPIAGAKQAFEQELSVDFNNGCAIKISVPENSYLVGGDGQGGLTIGIPERFDRYSKDRGFMLSCGDDISKAEIKHSPGRPDVGTGVWLEDSDEYARSLNSEMTDEEFQNTKNAIRFYSLNAINSKGFLFTIDDLIGDESRRGRLIRFCLARKEIALCGSGNAPVMYLSDGDSTDPTVFIKGVLETIEFLDEAQ